MKAFRFEITLTTFPYNEEVIKNAGLPFIASHPESQIARDVLNELFVDAITCIRMLKSEFLERKKKAEFDKADAIYWSSLEEKEKLYFEAHKSILPLE